MSDSDDPEKSTDSNVVKMVVRKTIATTPISILIESLVKNLCTMIESDEKRAVKIYNIICSKLHEMKLIDESYHMTEFEGMRLQYERALYRLVKAARGGEEIPKLIERIWAEDELHLSRYRKEFDELRFIAGGGFGQVFQVRHKLDGTEYAVKKIYIRSDGIKSVMSYVAEVKTFASLNHPNIVQYKAAWLELGAPTSKNALKPAENSTETQSSYHSPKPRSRTKSRTKKSTSDFTVEFEHSKVYSHSNDEISPRRSHDSRNSISEGGQAICKINSDDLVQDLTNPNQNWATLFIQMGLCQITLKNWLEKRNHSGDDMALVQVKSNMSNSTVMEILKQLLRGIHYIHSKGVVHHDIKPSNIFLQMEEGKFTVQLGDFGLACPLQNNKHSLALGTRLYAAPEQLEGKCNSKSDLYSLGIVILELVEIFRTDMERVRNITELRKGRLPTHLTLNEPQISQIISQLISKDPHKRPAARELLEKLNIENTLILDLRNQLAEKDIEISRLQKLLKGAGIEF